MTTDLLAIANILILTLVVTVSGLFKRGIATSNGINQLELVATCPYKRVLRYH